MINKYTKILFIYLISVFFALFFAPVGKYFDSIFSEVCGVNILLIFGIFDWGCFLQGFTYFFIFWLSLYSFYILDKKIAWLVFIIGSIFFWLVNILFAYSILSVNLSNFEISDVGTLIVMLLLFIFGFSIAIILKKIKNR